MYFPRLRLLLGRHDPTPCAMKPIDQLTDEELALLAQRAAALPDAPAALLTAANALMPVPPSQPAALPELARAATRLLAAALRFDSWAGAPVAFGMRALPADTRHLLFSAMGRDIDLRITPADERFALAGQILGPDESGRVELSGGGNSAKRVAAIDDLGEFRLDGIDSGTYLLTLRMGNDEIALPPIEVGGRHG
jgi:hypothetical protein